MATLVWRCAGRGLRLPCDGPLPVSAKSGSLLESAQMANEVSSRWCFVMARSEALRVIEGTGVRRGFICGRSLGYHSAA